MNFGFNSNVRVGGAVYHVQTEDRGPSHPFLDTVVYMAGRVVYKRKTNYEQFAKETKPEELAQKLHERLSQQHREVIAELEAGTLDLQGSEKKPQGAPKAGAENGLELKVMNPKTWFTAGNVILEIELREKNSERRVSDADLDAYLEHDKQRIPCAEARTDAKGCATLKFPMPADVAEGSSLVVRAVKGARRTELRFRLKARAQDKTPTPASR